MCENTTKNIFDFRSRACNSHKFRIAFDCVAVPVARATDTKIVMGAIVMTFNDLTVNYFCTLFPLLLLLLFRALHAFALHCHCPCQCPCPRSIWSFRGYMYLTNELQLYCNYRIFVNTSASYSTHTRCPRWKKVNWIRENQEANSFCFVLAAALLQHQTILKSLLGSFLNL